MLKSPAKLVLLSAAIALSACDRQPLDVASTTSTTQLATLESPPTQGALLAAIRAATAQYHTVENAIADGYRQISGCVSGEGVRYAKFSLLDGVVDPMQPEQLLYEPLPNGDLRLATVGFVVPQAAWTGSETPQLGVQPFMVRTSPPFGAPFPNYALFVWVWKHNPAGMYEQKNPELVC